MTREEYNNRTNENVSEDDFSFINRVCMAAGDSIDKDQFCKDKKKSGINPTIAALTERVEKAESMIAGVNPPLRHHASRGSSAKLQFFW